MAGASPTKQNMNKETPSPDATISKIHLYKQAFQIETERVIGSADNSKDEPTLNQVDKIHMVPHDDDVKLSSKEIVMSSKLDRASNRCMRNVTNRLAKEAILNAAAVKRDGVSEYYKYRK